MSKAEELYIDALFSDFLENERTSGGKVNMAYNEFMTALDRYIAAIQEETFKEVYMYLQENARVIKKV